MNGVLLLLAVVQIITESLPISSSTHLRLMGYLLYLSGVEIPEIARSAQWEMFDHLLHVPTLFVVGIVVWKLLRGGGNLLPALSGDPGDNDDFNVVSPSQSGELRECSMAALPYFLSLTIATTVTVAIYYIKKSALFASLVPWSLPTWGGLATSGGLLLLASYKGASKDLFPALSGEPEGNEEFNSGPPLKAGESGGSWISASLLVGLAQGCALVPGISRLGATYSTGVLVGLGRVPSLFFSLSLSFILFSGALVRAVLNGGVTTVGVLLAKLSPSMLLFSVICLVFATYISYRLLRWVVRLVEQDRAYVFSWYLFALSIFWLIARLP